MVDAYSWALSDIRDLTYRERKHWLDRYLYKLELALDRKHRQDNSTQTTIGSVLGGGVSFSGMPFR